MTPTTATILDGRKTRDSLLPALIKRAKALSHVPKLAIIQVGERPDSTSYISAKKAFAEKVGVDVQHIQLPENIEQTDLMKAIRECNVDPSVDGIILQLPLPEDIDRRATMDAIEPNKDVDRLTRESMRMWNEDPDALLPATARGIRELLEYYEISLKGKKVCVVGRSELVGKPVAVMCENAGAAVTVCHSKTPDVAAETSKADIVIVAAGKAGLIKRDYVKKGQIIIDVGINTITGEKLEDEIEAKRLVGDVDFDAVKDIVAAITPVPGGVGPMTVLALFENLIDLCKN